MGFSYYTKTHKFQFLIRVINRHIAEYMNITALLYFQLPVFQQHNLPGSWEFY